MRILIISCALFVALCSNIFAQTSGKTKKLAEDWNEGTITLSDGKTATGRVNYDKQKGYASYYDGENVFIYKNADILTMSFFDKKFNRKRTFYSLPYQDNARLFEVMAEFKKLVMLSIMGPIRTREKHMRDFDSFSFRSYTPGKTRSMSESAQIETIYLMNDEGVMKPYMDIVHTEDGEVSLFNWKDEKSKVLDTYEDNLPLILPQNIYDQLEKYADDNHLSLKSRRDFLEILENNRELLDRL